MRNGAIRVPSLVVIAIWLGAIAPALAAPELASDPSSLSAADGIFDALQRDMLMLKDGWRWCFPRFRNCRRSVRFCCGV